MVDTVAVTRAQALLIVVGDSSVLCMDPMWRGFMNYVYMNGGWRGDEPIWNTRQDVSMTADYARDMREDAASWAAEVIARLAEDDIDEGDANIDTAFVGDN